jgi:hypothetical protein
MERQMKSVLLTLLLLSLVLTGCVLQPDGAYGGHGYGDRNEQSHDWGGHDRSGEHSVHGPGGNWGR